MPQTSMTKQCCLLTRQTQSHLTTLAGTATVTALLKGYIRVAAEISALMVATRLRSPRHESRPLASQHAAAQRAKLRGRSQRSGHAASEPPQHRTPTAHACRGSSGGCSRSLRMSHRQPTCTYGMNPPADRLERSTANLVPLASTLPRRPVSSFYHTAIFHALARPGRLHLTVTGACNGR